MSDYNRNSRSGGRGGRGGDYRRRDSGRREMYSAVCAECGRDCEVPFRPTGDKPIYCSRCFENKEGGRDSRGPDRRRSHGSDYEKKDDTNKKMLDQLSSINYKLDRILNVIDKGNKKKPVTKKAEVKKVEKKVKSKVKKAKPKKTEKKEVKKDTSKEE
ncbi:CxxC-x17-CxxC domain-containing protein [Patescibacteria group bacterium]